MKEDRLQVVGRLLWVCLLAFAASCSVPGTGPRSGAGPVRIRIGWQLPAATQGHIAQVLKRTNLPPEGRGREAAESGDIGV